LQLERRTRDLAMFNLAIDSKLRGCDLMALRVDDVAPNGYAVDRATIRQSKTGRPVRFELTEVTRQALDDYLRESGLKAGQFLFPGRRAPDQSLTTRQYARLVSLWIGGIGLDPLKYATYSKSCSRPPLPRTRRWPLSQSQSSSRSAMISLARSPRRARSNSTARSRKPTLVLRSQLSIARCACSGDIALGTAGVVV